MGYGPPEFYNLYKYILRGLLYDSPCGYTKPVSRFFLTTSSLNRSFHQHLHLNKINIMIFWVFLHGRRGKPMIRQEREIEPTNNYLFSWVHDLRFDNTGTLRKNQDSVSLIPKQKIEEDRTKCMFSTGHRWDLPLVSFSFRFLVSSFLRAFKSSREKSRLKLRTVI